MQQKQSSLFVDKADVVLGMAYEGMLEKVAEMPSVTLPEDVGKWPRAVENELRKTHPYVGTYNIHVDFSSLEPQQKMAFGRIIISSRVSRPNETDGTIPTKPVQASRVPPKSVMVPFIINEGKLFPLDLMIANKTTQPLTEARLSKALFRPELHDTMSTERGDQLTKGLFRNGGTDPFAVPGTNFYTTQKLGEFSDLVVETGYVEHLAGWAEYLGSNDLVKQAAISNPVVTEKLKKIAAVSKSAASVFDIDEVAKRIEPTTTLLYRTEGGDYRFKYASADLCHPVEMTFDRAEAIKAFGQDLVKQADLHGMVLHTTVPEPDQKLTKIAFGPTDVKPVTKFGHYKVNSSLGVLDGMAFPYVYNPIREKRELFQVFVTPTVYGFAESIKGAPVDTALDWDADVPQGFGMFVIHDPSRPDGIMALTPVDVLSTTTINKVATYHVRSVTGEVFDIVRALEVKKPVFVEGTLFLPMSADWAPLGKQVDLLDSPPVADMFESRVVVTRSNYKYSLSGPPVARIQPNTHSLMDAVFLLGLLGLSEESARKILDKVDRQGSVEIYGCRTIKLLEPAFASAQHKVAELRKIAEDIRTDLLKEALFIEDPDSVDAVLSLNFINEDNIQEFINRIPRMEEVISTLSNLLLAVRLGLGDDRIPESAIQRALNGLDVVVDKLSRLKYAGQAHQ